jgi:hypothetical protein
VEVETLVAVLEAAQVVLVVPAQMDTVQAVAAAVVVESRMVPVAAADLEVAALLELSLQKLHIGMKFFNLTFSLI